MICCTSYIFVPYKQADFENELNFDKKKNDESDGISVTVTSVALVGLFFSMALRKRRMAYFYIDSYLS